MSLLTRNGVLGTVCTAIFNWFVVIFVMHHAGICHHPTTKCSWDHSWSCFWKKRYAKYDYTRACEVLYQCIELTLIWFNPRLSLDENMGYGITMHHCHNVCARTTATVTVWQTADRKGQRPSTQRPSTQRPSTGMFRFWKVWSTLLRSLKLVTVPRIPRATVEHFVFFNFRMNYSTVI